MLIKGASLPFLLRESGSILEPWRIDILAAMRKIQDESSMAEHSMRAMGNHATKIT